MTAGHELARTIGLPTCQTMHPDDPRPCVPCENADDTLRVRVHLNLTRGCFVISDARTKRLIRYANDVTLRDVTFKVSEKQRQWTIAKQMRQVHAWAFGTLAAIDSGPDITWHGVVTYNPFRAPTFTRPDGTPVLEASEVTFVDKKGWTP